MPPFINLIDIKLILFNYSPVIFKNFVLPLWIACSFGINPLAHAQDATDYGLFLDRQWQQLQFPIQKPNKRFVLSMEDRSWLNATLDPVVRNHRINQRYFQIATALQHCIFPQGHAPVANWYHFATWASVSAGDVINGKKFTPHASYDSYFWNAHQAGRITASELYRDRKIDDLFQLANVAMKKTGVNQWTAMSDYFDEQKVIFAETNYEIAAEMIPIGDAFLTAFCDTSSLDFKQKTRKDQDFFALFNPNESVLAKAFRHYRDAMLEADPKIKIEKALLASIEQVFFEQTRVQKNLYHSLNSPLEPTGLLGSRVLTMSAGFFFGDQGVRMIRDLRVHALAPELKEFITPELRAIFSSLGLSPDDPGSIHSGSACRDWSSLHCRKRFLAPLFRELSMGESEIYAF
jgi:hypothetical protein